MPDFVDWFVNREKQYQGLQKMLAGDTARSVMLVAAPAEMGKSWLVQRMRHHAEKDVGVPVMHVDFSDRRPYDYLSLVRLVRDQMGQSHFNDLTSTINNFTSVNININAGDGNSGDVNLDLDATNMSGGEVGVGDIAGRDIIKDNQFHIQADSDVARRAAEYQINDAFFACLEALLQTEGKAVFLFDSFENITEEAQRWIMDYLLLQKREGNLKNAFVVIAGHRVPELGSEFKEIVAKTGLDLFTEEHVREYILNRRQITDLDVDTIFKTSGGYPGLLAKMADVAQMDTEDDDDWL